MADPISSNLSETQSRYRPEGASAEEIDAQACLGPGGSVAAPAEPQVSEAPIPDDVGPVATEPGVAKLLEQYSRSPGVMPAGPSISKAIDDCAAPLLAAVASCLGAPRDGVRGAIACAASVANAGQCVGNSFTAQAAAEAGRAAQGEGAGPAGRR